ncbi:MAG: LamG-like jellyroll fold domain-containing protein [Pyrinomonadaceae bacterium]
MSITATTPTAGPQPGVFTITRTGNTSSALTIPYNIGGTATRDLDYTLSGPAGLDSPFAPGKVAQAFSLDGLGRYALFPNDPAQDPTAEATVDAWVFFNQTPSAAGHIMSIIAKSDFGRDLDLQAEQDNLFHFYVASGGLNVASTTVIQSGRWYHVAATYKANTELKMYVNGVLENTRAITVAREANGKPLGIGESLFFRGRFFKGLIDEAHMFNRALSAAEIQSIFAADSAGLCKPAPAANCLTPPAGLVGWWPGDGRTVDIENGNAGTLFGLNLMMGAGQTSLTVNVNPTGSTGSDGKNITLTILPTPDVYDLDGQASSALITLSGQTTSNDFALSSVEPNRGGDTGSITTTIFGQGILPGATVKLVRTGQPDIPGGQATVTTDGFSVTTVFDLTGKPQGGYDVIVTNPDGTSRLLANGFAVEPATPVQLFGKVIARAVIRIGNEYPFYIQYGNRGNTDAINVPLYVSVPNFVTITPDTNLPFQVAPDGDRTLVTVTLPRIRARSDRLAEFFTVKIKVTDPNQFHHIFQTRASIGQPFTAPAAGVAKDSAKDAARAEAGTVSLILPLDAPPSPAPAFPDTPPGDTDPRTPNDPNEKDGPAGFGPAGFITGADIFPYAIYFENKDTATLPAQDVVVTDQLDLNLVDLSTFSFGPISFGNRHVTPPLGQTQFVTQVDLRPAKQIVLRITGKLDTATGLLTWRFNSLDPVTGGPPDDPQAGFLPPNVNSPEGQGGILFTVKPKPGLATGTEVRNKARIVFDVNPFIDTAEWLNTIDNTLPVSHVAALPARTNTQSFTLNWSGTDVGASVAAYTIYVSQNGGPFTPFLTNTTLTSATFTGNFGATYSFYSVASDLAGNVEQVKTAAEATTTLVAPPFVQFSAAAYSVGEGDVRAQVTVTRTGDTSGPATVDYKTTDTDTFTVNCAATQGTAFGRCDFATSLDTLTFAPGQTSKTFNVPIIDDAHVEGNETFQVGLSNATGASLGTPATATVTIVDNDTVAGVNPIFTSAFFVRQHYLDFLAREPDAPGFNAYLNLLNGCPDVNNLDPASASAACDRLTVSGAFFGSPEFKDKGVYTIVFYRAALNRLPKYAEFVQDLRSVTGATPPETFAKRAAFASSFTQRPEFASMYGGLSDSAYVAALLGRYSLTQITTPDPAQPDGTQKVTLTSADLVNQLTAQALTRAQVLRAVVQSDEVGLNREALNAFVAAQYYGYLRRTPDTPGFNAWVNYLTAHPGDFRTMVNGFMNSQEYRLRFGNPTQ